MDLYSVTAPQKIMSALPPKADMRRKFINHQHGSALVYQTP